MDNVLTILRLASVIGVVSIGMTFVITGGGIDLSVGAIVALASVWCTTLATQNDGRGHPLAASWSSPRSLVGAGCGLVNGLLVAYGRMVPFIATLAMLAAARGLAEIICRAGAPRSSTVDEFARLLQRRRARHPGPGARSSPSSRWSAGCCSTAPRSGAAPSPSAATPRPPGWPASTSSGTPSCSTSLLGVCCGIAALMIVARTTTGTSTHGTLYELDAIAAVVIGGTLLSGGRGTIVGTVFGVLIFTTLTNVFTLNNLRARPGRRQGRDHRRRRPAAAAAGPAQPAAPP